MALMLLRGLRSRDDRGVSRHIAQSHFYSKGDNDNTSHTIIQLLLYLT